MSNLEDEAKIPASDSAKEGNTDASGLGILAHVSSPSEAMQDLIKKNRDTLAQSIPS